MTVLNIILAILLFLAAIFLIVAVLLQSGKSKGVSGAITGGSSETYFGKNKGKSYEKKLSLITTIVAIVFVVLALVAYVTQDYINLDDLFDKPSTSTPKTSASSVVDKSDVDKDSTDVSSSKSEIVDKDNTNPDNEK